MSVIPYEFADDALLSKVAESDPTYIEPVTMASRLVSETGVNVFLTGKAGTGKTTFLKSLPEITNKRMVVLAPTGVAAINAGGVTIHSFFQLSFAPFIPGRGFVNDEGKHYSFNKLKRNIIRTLDLIVIDEVSMVRPDVLDAMDSVLRRFRNPRLPFGGVQLLLIGDLRQLAPVAQPQEWQYLAPYYAAPYFFESHALKEAGYVAVELTKVYRQQDATFITILNKIRENQADRSTLEMLNRRAIPMLGSEVSDLKDVIRLTTHNAYADSINRSRLDAIDRDSTTYIADIEGAFPESSFPAERELTLKVGAKVMFIKNDISQAKEYYNGLIGTVSNLTETQVYVTTQEEIPRELCVGRAIWENTKYSLSSTGEIIEEVEGAFAQVPLRLAWAITIHKSQGLTFDRAIIDASRSFAPGQTYVALSRCRSLDGLYLDRPLPPSAIMTDMSVTQFIEVCKQNLPDSEALGRFKEAYYISSLHRLFDIERLTMLFEPFHRIVVTEVAPTYPKYADQTDRLRTLIQHDLSPVAVKTHAFINNVAPHRVSNPQAAELLAAKIAGGCRYFSEKISEIEKCLKMMPTEFDNRQVLTRLNKAAEELMSEVACSRQILSTFISTEFAPETYMAEKARILLSLEGGGSRRRSSAPTSSKQVQASGNSNKSAESTAVAEVGSVITQDIENPVLFSILRRWRLEKADEIGKPAFAVLSNRALMGLSAKMPDDFIDLIGIPGVGPAKIKQYGQDILDVVAKYKTPFPKKC